MKQLSSPCSPGTGLSGVFSRFLLPHSPVTLITAYCSSVPHHPLLFAAGHESRARIKRQYAGLWQRRLLMLHRSGGREEIACRRTRVCEARCLHPDSSLFNVYDSSCNCWCAVLQVSSASEHLRIDLGKWWCRACCCCWELLLLRTDTRL